MIKTATTKDLPEIINLYQHLNKDDQSTPSQDQINKTWAEISNNSKYFNLFIKIHQEKSSLPPSSASSLTSAEAAALTLSSKM